MQTLKSVIYAAALASLICALMPCEMLAQVDPPRPWPCKSLGRYNPGMPWPCNAIPQGNSLVLQFNSAARHDGSISELYISSATVKPLTEMGAKHPEVLVDGRRQKFALIADRSS